MNAPVTSDIFIVVVFEEYLPIVMKEGSFDVWYSLASSYFLPSWLYAICFFGIDYKLENPRREDINNS